jgi:hypothetical protein
MAHAAPIDIASEPRRADALAPKFVTGGLVVGGAGLGLSILLALVMADGAQFFRSYLTNYAYFLSLAIGALFFVLIQHVTHAGWSVSVRRLAEFVASSLPVMALLVVPVLIAVFAGVSSLYPWLQIEGHPDQVLLEQKVSYLNPTFFVVRVVVFLLVLAALARFFTRTSIAQDADGNPGLSSRMSRFSAPALILFAICTTFLAFDLVMSLKPQWYSTIFGVYYFAGAVVGGIALLILLAVGLQQAGRLPNVINPEHYHDLGKLLFAFVVFWAYIAFSQYMLYWYANIPETTLWLKYRQVGSWTNVSLLLLFGHFFVPFLLLISRFPKRRRGLLAAGAVWMLVVHWFDIYYLVAPTGKSDAITLHLLDGTLLLGVGGLFVAAVAWTLGRHCLIPERDPRLPEALRFENI